MALPLGKLTILIGAGLLGSVLAKEGRVPGVSDVLSGALKVVLKPLKQNDSAPATSRPRNNALIAQVNSLRQELQLLASSRSVTIVTSSRTGGRRVGVIIVIVVIGYGYVWWKGWKLHDFMFATKRSFNDARNSVDNQLSDVSHSLEVTEEDLSSQIDESSSKLDEIVECTTSTRDEVVVVSGQMIKMNELFQAVSNRVHTLVQKFSKIQIKQDETKDGVGKLLLCTLDEDNRLNDLIQDSSPDASRPALEHPRVALEHSRVAVPSRTVSLPAALPSVPSPSTSNRSSEINGHMGDNVSAVENASSPSISNGNHATSQPVRSAAVENGSRVQSESPTDTVPAVENASSPSVSNGNHVTPQPVRNGGFLSRWFSFSDN
ncbi:uncharacterized protein LOC141637790 [Silene latifolia]|uniref:uncharacterized protein LOC141637790 n=1 Tax=Silene latifolia TaxID=37657 RepID=UPI003D780845